MGVTCYIGRSDSLCLWNIFAIGNISPTSTKEVISKVTIFNIYDSITINRTVLTSAIDTVEDVSCSVRCCNT